MLLYDVRFFVIFIADELINIPYIQVNYVVTIFTVSCMLPIIHSIYSVHNNVYCSSDPVMIGIIMLSIWLFVNHISYWAASIFGLLSRPANFYWWKLMSYIDLS